MSTRGVWAFTAVLVAPAACGDGSAQSGGPAAVPEAEYLDRLVAAVCDNVAACCGSSGLVFDDSRCRENLRAFYGGLLIHSGVSGVRYDPNAAGECVAALEEGALACRSFARYGPCFRAYVGTKAEGEPCDEDLQCVGAVSEESHCDFGDGTGAPICARTPRGTAGEGCDETCSYDTTLGSSCESFGPSSGTATCYTNDGLYCSRSAEVCTPIRQLGEVCSESAACIPGSYCSESARCAEQKPDGAVCSGYRECRNECVPGADGINGHCEAGSETFADDTICGVPPP